MADTGRLALPSLNRLWAKRGKESDDEGEGGEIPALLASFNLPRVYFGAPVTSVVTSCSTCWKDV